jgi:hypothetical protein
MQTLTPKIIRFVIRNKDSEEGARRGNEPV